MIATAVIRNAAAAFTMRAHSTGTLADNKDTRRMGNGSAGLVGFGMTGWPMVPCMANAGVDLVVYDVDSARHHERGGDWRRAAGSLAKLEIEVGTVTTMLSNSEIVSDVRFWRQGCAGPRIERGHRPDRYNHRACRTDDRAGDGVHELGVAYALYRSSHSSKYTRRSAG